MRIDNPRLAVPVDPESVSFVKQYSFETAVYLSNRVRACSMGSLRIAHNSLYALANKLGDPQQNAAHQARERLWAEILTRDRF